MFLSTFFFTGSRAPATPPRAVPREFFPEFTLTDADGVDRTVAFCADFFPSIESTALNANRVRALTAPVRVMRVLVGVDVDFLRSLGVACVEIPPPLDARRFSPDITVAPAPGDARGAPPSFPCAIITAPIVVGIALTRTAPASGIDADGTPDTGVISPLASSSARSRCAMRRAKTSPSVTGRPGVVVDVDSAIVGRRRVRRRAATTTPGASKGPGLPWILRARRWTCIHRSLRCSTSVCGSSGEMCGIFERRMSEYVPTVVDVVKPYLGLASRRV